MAVATGLVALALLLGAGAAQAFTVQFTGENATGILNLEVGSTFYNITFQHETAQDIYGTVSLFDFITSEGAEEAMEAVNAALDSEPEGLLAHAVRQYRELYAQFAEEAHAPETAPDSGVESLDAARTPI